MEEIYFALTTTQLKQLRAFFLEQKAKDAIPYLNMLGSLPTTQIKQEEKKDEPATKE